VGVNWVGTGMVGGMDKAAGEGVGEGSGVILLGEIKFFK